jgi:hypothetical protein
MSAKSRYRKRSFNPAADKLQLIGRKLQSRKRTRRGYERGIRLISVESIERFLAQPPKEATA